MKKLSYYYCYQYLYFVAVAMMTIQKHTCLACPITKLIHLIWAIKKIRMIHGLLVATGGQLTTNIIY